jgi:hypothetical protein
MVPAEQVQAKLATGSIVPMSQFPLRCDTLAEPMMFFLGVVDEQPNQDFLHSLIGGHRLLVVPVGSGSDVCSQSCQVLF